MKKIGNTGAFSLCQFIKLNGLRLISRDDLVLEIGPGNFPVSKELFNINLNNKAENKQIITYIEQNKDCVNQNLIQDYIIADYLDYQFKNQFDSIIDGHVFHTLASSTTCFTYLEKVFQDLAENGYFFMETMVSHDQLYFEDFELFFDYQKAILYKNSNPSRIIYSTNEIEILLIKIGFKILYFNCPPDLKMIPLDEREVALATDPDILRVICQKITK